MFSEKQFEVLRMLKENPFLKRESFDSEESFDDACQVAKEMFDNGIIESPSEQPYRRNTSGSGSAYAIMGKFMLTTEAREAVEFERYEVYRRSQPRNSQWSLSNRLAAWGIFAALLGTAAAVYFAYANGT